MVIWKKTRDEAAQRSGTSVLLPADGKFEKPALTPHMT
jgi:hypothetical protein